MDRREFLKASGLLALSTQLPTIPAGQSIASEWVSFTPALTAGPGEVAGWYRKDGALVTYLITPARH